MKNQTTVLAFLVLLGLATGCKRSDTADANPPGGTNPAAAPMQAAKDYANAAMTNTVFAATQAWTGMKVSVQLAMGYAYDQKAEFVAETGTNLAVLDRKIQDLSDKAANATDTAQAGLQTKLQQLRAKRAILDRKLAAVKSAAGPDWEAAKADFKSACADVDTAFADAWHSLTSD